MPLLEGVARGLKAGFAGTVAITASQRIEMAVSGRPPSDLPVKVASGVLGLEPRGRRARAVVAFSAHWFNNTTGGLGRATLGAAGLHGPPAVAGTFVLYLAGSAVLFRRAGIPSGLRPVDAIHAAVYAVTTSAAYERLERADYATAGSSSTAASSAS